MLNAGVGYGALIAAAWLNIFYIVVLAWAIYYLVASMTTALPWASCYNWWNTPNCRSYYQPCNDSDTDCGSGNFTSPVREFWEYVDITYINLSSAAIRMRAQMTYRLCGTSCFPLRSIR